MNYIIENARAEGKRIVPMTIRIKYEHGQWWAYYGGWYRSYQHSDRLDWLCTAIAAMFPKGSEMVYASATSQPREAS